MSGTRRPCSVGSGSPAETRGQRCITQPGLTAKRNASDISTIGVSCDAVGIPVRGSTSGTNTCCAAVDLFDCTGGSLNPLSLADSPITLALIFDHSVAMYGPPTAAPKTPAV